MSVVMSLLPFPRRRLALACLLASVSGASFAQTQCDVAQLQQSPDLAAAISSADYTCYSGLSLDHKSCSR
ncbi:hypothetical protein, partial [Vibrio vulnificus]|uniref:hypothetical protein n=1 Tax=Vibrio vulnificus TaxID=672 RepID=UPI00111BABE0